MNNPIIRELFDMNEYGKKLIKLENIQTFILSGRLRKDDYSSLINAQKCKLRWKKLKAKSNDFVTKKKERKRKLRTEIKKDQERHARYKEDDKLKKWAAKKKKKVANDQEVANVEEVAEAVHVQEVVHHLHQPLALHFRADNIIGAFQELTCIYQTAPTKSLKLFKA